MAKVIRKQKNSLSCFICGLENSWGLKGRFYDLDTSWIVAVFNDNHDNHNSYEGRMHGGIISAILDETIGRALWNEHPDDFGVTGNITVNFKKPVPLNKKLYCIGKITVNNRFYFDGIGRLYDEFGNLLATASARYVKQDVKKISDADYNDANWFVEKDSIPFDFESIESLFDFSDDL